MRISDWSSDVCSSDLRHLRQAFTHRPQALEALHARHQQVQQDEVEIGIAGGDLQRLSKVCRFEQIAVWFQPVNQVLCGAACDPVIVGVEDLHCLASPEIRCTRSEEHTSELQSLMRISYAVFCLKKKKNN